MGEYITACGISRKICTQGPGGMLKETLGGQPSIRKYVAHKIAQLENSDRDMRSLFRLIFSEKENVLAESTDGYKIRSLTYGESLENVRRKTARLAALLGGVPRGSVVGLCLANSPDWIETFWAILQAGYKPLLINDRLDDGTIADACAACGVKAAVSDGRQFGVRHIHLAQLLEDADASSVTDDRFENEIFLMSSNSSQHLKICGYTGEQFYHQILDSAAILRRSRAIKKHYKGRLKLLALLPFCHIFGLAAVYIWFCFFSRTLVFLKDLAPDTIVNTVRKHRVTHIFAVPLFWETVYKSALVRIRERGHRTYEKFLRGLKLCGVPLLGRLITRFGFREVRDNLFGESVCFCISGGGAISADVLRFVNAAGYPLSNGYGMTEIGITSVELSGSARVRMRGSVGAPFASAQYRIGDGGELFVRTPAAAKELFCDGARTEQNGWFNTHDLFAVKRGRYYIQGRKDDLLVCSNGENINPDMTEQLFRADGVQRVCLLPSPRQSGKIVLVAEVSKYLGGQRLVSIRNALALRAAQLGIAAVLAGILLTDQSLLDANDFKLVRKKIAARLAEGTLGLLDPDDADAATEEADRALTKRLTELFAKALNRREEEIGENAHFFFDLGGNSLDYFAMIASVQEEFGISFPATDKAGITTIRQLKDYIQQNL